MILLILALIFGIAVLAVLLVSMIRGRKKGNSKLVNVLKVIIIAEAAVYVVIFIIVFIKTMAA